MNGYTVAALAIILVPVWYYLTHQKKPYKGTVIFDCDGVIVDFYSPFISHYNKHYKKNLNVSDLYHYNLSRSCEVPQSFIDDFHNEKEVANLPLHHPETAEFIKNLRREGYRIILNTGFPVHHQEKRYHNLKIHDIEYDFIHFQQKKEILDLYPDIICMFEDDPKLVQYYVEKGMKVYVPNRPYLRNEPYLFTSHPQIKRYSTFNQLYEIFGIR